MLRLIAGFFSFFALAGIAAIGGLGLVIWLYDRDLPDSAFLAEYQPATLSRVFSGDGALLGEFASERRIFTPIDEIPEIVRNAFIAAEDRNFYSHVGVDATGVARAALANLQAIQRGGGQIQGGSTITQQVMKNFLLTSDRSIERKIKEAILSVRIERALSKDRILELYLNEIFLGQNAYGVTAAAQRYFGKALEDLTIGEAAFLAALPQAPSALHPVRNAGRALARRNYVLRQMEDNGFISSIDRAVAEVEPIRTLLDDSVERQIATAERPGFFTEEIRRQLSRRLGDEKLFGGGLTIRATIDRDAQAIAERALQRALITFDRERRGWAGPVGRIEDVTEADWRDRFGEVDAPRRVAGWRRAVVLGVNDTGARIGVEGEDATASLAFSESRGWTRARAPGDLWRVGDVVFVEAVGDGWSLRQIPEVQGAFMAMDVATGRVLALQGGFDHDASVFNRATQARRQPGSAFKPVVYAAALEMGYDPSTIILDAPIVIDSGSGDLWRPRNSSGRFYGPSPMRVGLEMSRNLMTIRLAQEIGLDAVAEYARRFGVYEDMPPLLSFALGAGETTLWDLTAAYAMLANGGVAVEPTVFDRVQDRHGATILRHGARRCEGCDGPFAGPPRTETERPRHVVHPITAYQITSMLEGATTRGTAARAFADVPVRVAGKTGTTNDARDVWFVGYTPQVAAGCFIGFDEPRPLGRGAFGGTLCAPVVAEFFREFYRDRPSERFAPPSDIVIAAVDRWSGDAAEDGDEVIYEVFRSGDARRAPRVIGGDDDFFFASGGDLPFEREDSPVENGAAPTRPTAPSGGGFATPGGLY
ncbi:MAG: PBP1A family penicillin-binding protein [Rhodobacteraceae bacterium]|nr:MAG: PBP1A family penicillin-binding protein [Paracoccaceae bacterium]